MQSTSSSFLLPKYLIDSKSFTRSDESTVKLKFEINPNNPTQFAGSMFIQTDEKNKPYLFVRFANGNTEGKRNWFGIQQYDLETNQLIKSYNFETDNDIDELGNFMITKDPWMVVTEFMGKIYFHDLKSETIFLIGVMKGSRKEKQQLMYFNIEKGMIHSVRNSSSGLITEHRIFTKDNLVEVICRLSPHRSYEHIRPEHMMLHYTIQHEWVLKKKELTKSSHQTTIINFMSGEKKKLEYKTKDKLQNKDHVYLFPNHHVSFFIENPCREIFCSLNQEDKNDIHEKSRSTLLNKSISKTDYLELPGCGNILYDPFYNQILISTHNFGKLYETSIISVPLQYEFTQDRINHAFLVRQILHSLPYFPKDVWFVVAAYFSITCLDYFHFQN